MFKKQKRANENVEEKKAQALREYYSKLEYMHATCDVAAEAPQSDVTDAGAVVITVED